jgi:endoglucanase
VLNNAVVLGVAYDLTDEAAYADAAPGGLDYALGRNPLNQSYVTGYGERDSHNQHGRHWANQLDPACPPPPPGTLADGPSESESASSDYGLEGCAPALCYVDDTGAHTVNAVTINWNAPLAWMGSSFADDLGGSGGGAYRSSVGRTGGCPPRASGPPKAGPPAPPPPARACA